MMFQVFKSAVGHSIFGGSVIIHWQAQWIWTWKKIAMSDSQAFCVCFLLSLFFKNHECWIFGRRKPLPHLNKSTPPQSHDLRSTDHVCKFKERYHPHPTPPQSHDLRSTDHVCKFKERYHPHPTPPQSHDLRSTDHVCKCKEHDVA